MKKKYYAVKNGKKTGIFMSWDECKAQVDGFSGAIYKSFSSEEEALEFLGIKKEDLEFLEKEKKEVLAPKEIRAYVDGSFNPLTLEYGSGVVILHEDEITELKKKGNDEEMASMRNVAGEIIGASLAMDWFEENIVAGEGYFLSIYYDYTGIENWGLNRWKTNKKGTIAYKARTQDFIKKYSLKFVKVKAHSGNKYNDLADKLAKEAAGVE